MRSERFEGLDKLNIGMEQTDLELERCSDDKSDNLDLPNLNYHFIKSKEHLQLGLDSLTKVINMGEVNNILSEWRSVLEKDGLNDSRIDWIVKTIQSDSEFRKAANLKEHVFIAEPVKLFEAGSWLCVHLKRIPKVESNKLVNSLVLLQLIEPLKLEKGKSAKMQCGSCECELHILYRNPVDITTTAARLSLDSELIACVSVESGHLLTVKAESINHAYTIASKMLETERRSHGGSVFQNISFLNSEKVKAALETARSEALSGSWKSDDYLSSLKKCTYSSALSLYD